MMMKDHLIRAEPEGVQVLLLAMGSLVLLSCSSYNNLVTQLYLIAIQYLKCQMLEKFISVSQWNILCTLYFESDNSSL